MFQGLCFHCYYIYQLVQKPFINLSYAMNLFNCHEFSFKGLVDCKNSLVSALGNPLADFCIAFFFKSRQVQIFYANFKSSGCFQDCLFKVLTYCHNFAGCLHLSTELAGRINKFIKRKLRHFYNNVVENRFKAGLGFLCYKVWNLVQGKAYSNQSCYLCNRISCCF